MDLLLVTPYSGISEIKASSDRYPGIFFSGDITNGTFNIDVPLKVEANQIDIIATDLSGNEAQASISIDRSSPPRFSNITPLDGAFVTEDTLTIAGEVLTFLPLTDVSFFVNEWQITPTGTNEEGRYTFELPGISLNYGDNTFNLSVVTSDGTDNSTLTVNYMPENAENIAAPSVEILSPVDGQLLKQRTFRLASRVTSVGGPVSISINGNLISTAPNKNDDVTFSTVINFPDGADTLDVTVSATDSLGKQTIETARYSFDGDSPVIALDQALSSSPIINPVLESPYVISGRVSDQHLASFLVNEQSVNVKPGVSEGDYTFTFSTDVPLGSVLPIHIQATDFSGNQTQIEYQLQSTAQAGLSVILPLDESEFVSQGTPIEVQTVVRVQGLDNTDIVYAKVDEGNDVILERVSDLVSGNVLFPEIAGQYTLQIGVRNQQGTILAQTSRRISISAEDNVDIALVRIEPENGQKFVEINAPVEMYFNRQIDITKLSISLRETLHGSTYINDDPLGLDFLNAKGYQLKEVNRDFEVVNGQLDILPGGTSVAFYPDRAFGFNADLFLEINYDGQELSRTHFKVRELPTFVNGSVSDQFGQPLAGVLVSIPELNRTAVTNGDGGFAFGYQESAEKVIPGGRYTIIVNDNFNSVKFGTESKLINLQQGRQNDIGILKLQELNESSPFQVVSSGSQASLASGELSLDLSQAKLIFPNGRDLGRVHTQFLPFEHLTVQSIPNIMPMWMFSNQPRGIEVNGEIGVTMKIPPLGGNYDYLNDAFKYVVLLGYNPEAQVLEPVGVGRINGTQVISEGAISMKSFDFFGYALINPQHMPLLESVAKGEKSLQQLQAELQNLQ